MGHPFGKDPVRVLVCGDRKWEDEGVIGTFLGSLPPGSTIIHGDCEGADRIAGRIAEEIGLVVEKYPARWDIYGVAAGPIRNRFMAEESDPSYVVCFHDDLQNSKGSKDMVDVATNFGLTVILFATDSFLDGDEW